MTPRSEPTRTNAIRTLTRATYTYWSRIHFDTRREQGHWRLRACSIPSAALRTPALQAHEEKWSDIEGAAAFATFLPPARRIATLRALVAFQVAFDYVDNVAEQPARDRQANTRQLHSALLAALDPAAHCENYYANSTHHADNDYLQRLVDATRQALATLPRQSLVSGHLRRAAQRIIAYQSINHSQTRNALATWEQTPPAPAVQMCPWELFASGGSSLDILALIAAAANPTLTQPDADALAGAYSPLIGGIHTLLDSLVDYAQDNADAQRSLIDEYTNPRTLADGLQRLARQAMARIDDLPQSGQHRLLFTAMSCLYLSASETSAAHARLARSRLIQQLDWTAAPMLQMLRLRRAARIIRQFARTAQAWPVPANSKPRKQILAMLISAAHLFKLAAGCEHPYKWPRSAPANDAETLGSASHTAPASAPDRQVVPSLGQGSSTGGPGAVYRPACRRRARAVHPARPTFLGHSLN